MTGLSALANTDVRQTLNAQDLGAGDYFWHACETFDEGARLLIPGAPMASPWGEDMSRPSLGDWAATALRLARCYRGLGVEPRDPVGVYGPLGAGYLLHYLALTRLGAIPVLLNENMPGDVARAYLAGVGARFAYCPTTSAADWEETPFRLIGHRLLAEADERPFEPFRFEPDDPVLVTHSSGTTGVPKAVTLKHRPYFYAMLKSLEGPRDPAVELAVSALPPSHNAAIGAAAIAVVNGERLVIMPSQDGVKAAEAIRQHQAGCLVAFPKTFVDILEADIAPDCLDSLQMWVNLGDAAHEAHYRRLTRFGHHFKNGRRLPGSRFVDGLGSSEMGSMLFTKVHEPSRPGPARCVGTPAHWVEAAILSEDGTALPDGTPGLLGVRSPGTFSGYWNNASLTESSVLGGYFLTGDIAVRDEQGQFFHLDRVSDQVRVDGDPIHSLSIEEAVLLSSDEVLDCCVVVAKVAENRALVKCIAVLRPSSTISKRALLREINSHLKASNLEQIDLFEIVDREALPVGVTGKTLKAKIRADLLTRYRARNQARGSWSGGFNGRGEVVLAETPLPLSLAPSGIPDEPATISPLTLIIGSASGCYLATLATLIGSAGISGAQVSIESEGEMSADLPPKLKSILHRPTVELTRETGARSGELERLFEIARQQCPTANLLRDVETRIEGKISIRNS